MPLGALYAQKSARGPPQKERVNHFRDANGAAKKTGGEIR